MNAIALKDLKLGQDCIHLFTITVKVLKLWVSENQNKVPIGIEAIFVDNEGTIIHGSATKRMVKFLQSRLEEGATVKITNFDLEENSVPKFQKGRVNHQCKIMLIYGTKVVKCRPDLSIMTNGIKLIPFRELDAADSQFYVDVIGQVVRVGEISVVDKWNARMLDIELRDDSNVTLKCVLWESFADRLLKLVPETGVADAGIIIILQFALKSKFQSELRVGTAYHATKMYVNEKLPEFEEFHIRKRDNGNASITFLTADPRSLKPEEWLNMEAHRTPLQVKQSTTVGSYIMFGSLLKVDEQAPWYYMSCSNCNGNARKAMVGDTCSNAKCAGQAITKLIPKFRVKFIAKGANDEKIVLVLFEEAVAKYISKNCQIVYEEWKKEEDEEMIPLDFCDLLYRDFLMKVRVTDYNLKGDKFKEFSVDVMTDDPVILEQYAMMNKEDTIGINAAIESRLKAKEKVTAEPDEDASNDVEGFVTPRKRASSTDSDDETLSSLGTKKSSSKLLDRPIKKEKP